MAELVQYYGTGRRKSSIARVFLRPGSGKFTVNGKDSEVYFVTAQQRAASKRSLQVPGIEETFDVITTVKGGGVMGQADAVKLGNRARFDGIQPGAAQGAQERGSGDPRLARQGTQEVRPEGRTRSLPVQQALIAPARG